VWSRAAGAPGYSPKKEVGSGRNGANTTSAASSFGRAVGHETHTGIMILALATRHRVERPAISMGGGTKNPMERLARRRLDTPLFYIVKSEIRTT